MTTDELPEWAQNFLKRIKQLEKTVNDKHEEDIVDIEKQLEEHDTLLKRLTSEQTVIKLIITGVDAKLDRVLAAVEKECNCD